MTSLDYQVLSRRIYSNFPVIGWLLRRWAAWQLAKDDGSGEAVAILAEVVTRGQDRAVREMAIAVLNRLRSQDAINGFCRVWVETRHKDLAAILRSRRYVATEPRLRVLSALKVGALDVVKRGGVEVLDFLLAALNDRDTQVATAAASCVSALENRVVIDELCRRWVESRSSQLEGIIRQGGYVASQPVAVRVLTALKLNQIQEISDGGIEVLDCVLKAFDDRDMEVVRSAKIYTTQLKNEKMISFLYEKWIENQSSVLQTIIQEAGYEPSELSTKALFFFLFGEWKKYEGLDSDQSLLSKAYFGSSDRIQKLIAHMAKTAERIEWIKILTNAEKGFDIEQMTNENWNTFIDILVVQLNREELWKFLSYAPAIWSKKLLDRLANISYKWFSQANEDTVKTLLNLSSKVKEEIFTSIPYLDFQQNNYKTLKGHNNDDVTWLAISPNGDFLLSSNIDKERLICIWSLPDGQLLKVLEGGFVMRNLTISHDSRIFISCSFNRGNVPTVSINIWSLPDGILLNTITAYRMIESLSISQDGTILAFGCDDGSIQVWNLVDGKHLKTLTDHTGSVTSLNISSDSQILVSYSKDKTARLWHLPDATNIKTIEVEPNFFCDCKCVISPNGQILALPSGDVIQLWSLPDGNHLNDLKHSSNIEHIGISPDSQTLVSYSSGNKISIWDLRGRSLVKSFRGLRYSKRPLISLDGSTLVMCDLTDICLWDLSNGNHLKTLTEVHIIPTIMNDCSLAISPDGHVLALASIYKDIRLWNLPCRNKSRSIALITDQEIAKMEVQIKDSTIEEDFRIIFEFILTLINIRRSINDPIKIKTSSISTTKPNAEEKIKSLNLTLLQSKSADVLFNIGNTKFLSGDIEGALASFSESIKLNPNNPNSFFNRANIKYHLGDKRGAINDYSEAIKINPQYFDAWYGRGVVKFELSDFNGALVDHNEAIKINPEFANAYFGRGNAKRALGDKEGASIDHNIGFRLQKISH